MKNIINRIKNDKVLFFLSILIIGVFLVLVIRITYSYLAAFINEARENVTIGSDTTDKLEFFEGNPIDLNVTSTTLPEGGGNYAQSTTYRAELTANSTTNSAEDSYYVYFNVTANTLNYTQEGNPEVILTVFQDDTEITNIDGLTYGTYNGVTGFDVTTASGMFTVASDYAITSNSSTDATVQNWTFNLTYLNQNYDQSGNYGNKMSVEFIMSKEERILTLAEYITDYVYVEDGVNSLYYHDGQGAYTNADQEAGDNSYRYAGGDYQVTNTAINGGYTEVGTSSNTATNGVVNFYYDGSKSHVGAFCDASYTRYYTTAYNETVQYSTYEEALETAVSDGYLTKDNVKNFVCFGSNETPCPEGNLYRIIGVFNGQIKLIKYTYADSTMLGTDGDYDELRTNICDSGMRNDCTTHYNYYWNNANYSVAYQETGYYNVWSYSALNTINLNTNYLNYLGNAWGNLIANHTWKVGGISHTNQKIQTVYQEEIINPNADVETEYSAKIGLMYVSDYGYAFAPSGWTTNLGSYNTIQGNNWMYMGALDWTISRISTIIDDAWNVYENGSVDAGYLVDSSVDVRPVFYLTSTTQYVSGTGTQADPYRIV